MAILLLALLHGFLSLATAQEDTPRCSRISARCNNPFKLSRASAFCTSILGIGTLTTTVYPSATTVPLTTCNFTPSVPPPPSSPPTETTHAPIGPSSHKPKCLGGATNWPQWYSACACLPPFTSPTATVTNTEQHTLTGPFHVKACGGSVDGQYFVDEPDPGLTFIVFTPSEAEAGPFYLDQHGWLYDREAPDKPFVVYVGPRNEGQSDWPVRQTDQFAGARRRPIVCEVDAGCALKCSGDPGHGFNVSSESLGDWRLSDREEIDVLDELFEDPYVVLL
ncbi:uncharacterized protein LTR77_010843 [Saxophila tyrrhenica]|uniref:Uncharacterized protein n=1 Tax=Saxophila tyrrhenica TaxID=1690608 RepID=A0AAV9NW55_9PEZI|nr:hypothetical protein LTR77_010843 [Saxophila tyrrhenica]